MLRRYTSSGSTVEDKVPFFNCLTHKRGTYEFTQLRHYKRYLFQYSSNINIFNTFCVIYVTVTTYTILTYNFQILLLLYLILAVVVDILVSRNKSNDISENMQKLVNIRSIFFVCAVLPLGVITSLLFWPLFLYDPYFFAPPRIMDFVSIAIHINEHLINLVPILFELLYGKHKFVEYMQGVVYSTAFCSIILAGYVIFFLYLIT